MRLKTQGKLKEVSNFLNDSYYTKFGVILNMLSIILLHYINILNMYYITL